MYRYSFGKRLGEGAFGAVRLAQNRETGEQVRYCTAFFVKCIFAETKVPGKVAIAHKYLLLA